jgi:DNA-binding NarL/FixJ family response regulator
MWPGRNISSCVDRIAIIDDHPIFRDGLKRLLESEPGFSVVGEGSDGIEAVRLVREIHR